MIITFADKGECPIPFNDFCSRILWAVKPKIEKDMMLHGIGYVRENYPDYERQLSIIKKLNQFCWNDEYHEWVADEGSDEAIVVNDNTINSIMNHQGKCLVEALCNGFEEENRICFPIRVESVSERHISIELDMTDVPLAWLILVAKIYNCYIQVIYPDYLNDNPFLSIETYTIDKSKGHDDVLVFAFDEILHCIVNKTLNQEKSGSYSFENTPASFLEPPESTVPAMVFKDGTQLYSYNPIAEFRENGGSLKQPTVESLIDRTLPYSLSSAFSDVIERFDKDSETRKLLSDEIKLFKRKGWDDYIVFISKLIQELKEKCISFKGSAMDSLLLQYSMQKESTDLIEYSKSDFNGSLVLECNVVGLSDIIDGLKKDVSNGIENLASYYWYSLYQVSENEYVISMLDLNSKEKNDLASGKADRNKYLTIKVNTWIGL